MPRKKKPPLSFVESMKKLAAASLQPKQRYELTDNTSSDIGSIEDRIRRLLGLVERQKKNKNRMLFFIMYDIESNKVRALVHKYLKRMGCTPIQRSIFLADTAIEIYNQIKSDLAEVQEAYDNNDSIIVLPVSTDYLRMMKIIGKKIEVDVITHNRNTLFF